MCDVYRIVRQTRYQNVTQPDWSSSQSEPLRKFQRWTIVFSSDFKMSITIPALDIQHDKIDLVEFGIRQALAKESVCIECCMNAHLLSRRKQTHTEAVLHQWFSPTQGETTSHDTQALSILGQFFSGSLQSNRHAIHHVPGIRIVTVKATKLTTCRPGH